MTQNPPKKGKQNVPNMVITQLSDLYDETCFDEGHFSELNKIISGIKDGIKERDELGKSKYGTSLETFNGRDANLDAQEELLDAFQYITQAFAENKLDRKTIELLGVLHDYASSLYNILFLQKGE